MSITRTTVTDDDGTGTTGTIANQAWLTTFYDTLDGRWSEVSTTSTGNQDNVDFTQADTLRCNNATTITLRGLLAPASPAKPGKRLIIVSVGAGSVVLNDQDANSTAANRIITGTSAAVTLTAGTGWAVLIYDDVTDRWRVVGSSVVNLTGAIVVAPLNRQTGDASNVGTAETVLRSYTLPAAKLAATGDTVRVRATGVTAANANVKTLKLHFGATVVATYGVMGNNVNWIAEAEISRTGAATQIAWGGIDNATSGAIQTTTAPTETLSGTVVIKATGQSDTASGDLTLKNFSVEFVPAP